MHSQPIDHVPAPRCQLGEAPVWDEARARLYWSDIDAGAVYGWSPGDRRAQRIYRGVPVGGMVLTTAGALALFRRDDIALLGGPRAGARGRAFADAGTLRFNDAVADRRGRTFAGTIGRTRRSGGVFCFEPGGRVRSVFRGTGCSNGMAFSPDDRTFYWTCSTTRRIFAFDFDAASGQVARRRVLSRCADDDGVPDGLCVDAEGMIWSARWGAGVVVRLAPHDGRVVARFRFPAAHVTSCCFGGTDRSTLFVTSAAHRTSPGDRHGGRVFVVPTGTRGLRRHRARFPHPTESSSGNAKPTTAPHAG